MNFASCAFDVIVSTLAEAYKTHDIVILFVYKCLGLSLSQDLFPASFPILNC